MVSNLCVYTVLIGDYEKLNEQPVAKDSRVEFFCFTDNPTLASQSWKIIHVEPVFPLDSVRSSRFLKMRPHHLLKGYETSIYIDNSIVLKQKPEDIYDELMGNSTTDMVCFKHSYRETVLDEFIEVATLQYDDLNVIMEQFNAYSISDPNVLQDKPLNCGFLIRNHHQADIVKTMDEWLAHTLRYSRRDQLSINFALRKNKPKYVALDVDIRNSKYLIWPVIYRRNNKQEVTSNLSSFLFNQLVKKEQAIKESSEIRKSKAWKLLQQYHRFRKWLRK